MSKYTITEYAKRVEMSRTYIYKLEKEGRIDFMVKGGKKYVESDQVDPIVKFEPAHRTTNSTYQENGSKRPQKGLGPEAASKPIGKIKFSENSERIELERAKLYEASRKLKIANDLSDSKYYKKTEINEKSFDLFRQLRDGMQSLKDRVALKCRAADSDHEARKILNDEVHNILNSIVDGYNLDDEAVKKKLLSLLI